MAAIAMWPNGLRTRSRELRIDPATGLLDPLGHTPTETQPRGFAIDPSGRFLVVAGQKSYAVTSYAIDPATGSLTPGQQLGVGRDPSRVETVARR